MISLLIGSGILGAIGVLLAPNYSRYMGIGISLFTWGIFIYITQHMDFNVASLQWVEVWDWIPYLKIQWFLGMDNLSWLMCALTLLIHSVVLVSMMLYATRNVSGYMALFFLLQSMTLGVFTAMDAIVFYLFWEGMLIPLYLCISGWGSDQAGKAAMKFFMFTFVGSLSMLIGFLYLGWVSGHFNLEDWVDLPLNFNQQFWLFLSLFPAFAIKVPMFPVHTWLPLAHTEAPSEGSVVLAGLMLKVGAYGFIRIMMPVLPDACRYFSDYVVILSLIAIVYVGMVAYAQTDIKKLIAYSSVSHMGFVTLGLFLLYTSDPGSSGILLWSGAVMQMITHAFGSGALFLSFGMLYLKSHKREVNLYSGLYQKAPMYSMFFMLFVCSTIGVPGTAGFIGEWAVIVGSIMAKPWAGMLALSGLLLSAGYLLNLVRQILYGKPSLLVSSLSDINRYEACLLGFLSLWILGIGIYPYYGFQLLKPSANALVKLALSSKVGGIL